MAKKKKTKKKTHRRVTSVAPPPASQPAGPSPITNSQAAPAAAPLGGASQPAPIESTSRRHYLGSDVRRIAVLVVLCVAAELALWFAFNELGLGSRVYGLIK